MFDLDDVDLDQHDHFSALNAGTAYALFRHGQDRQTEALAEQLRQGQHQRHAPTQVDVVVNTLDVDEDPRNARRVAPLDLSAVDMPDSWDDYIGQDPLKRRVMVAIASARARGASLPHMLFASGFPGVGKTTMARLVAKAMGVDIIELVPPFNIWTLVQAAEQLDDGDVLFIDEIHRLAVNGKKGTEILLKVLEEKKAYMPDGSVVELADITVIGATTESDALPETVLDRMPLKPYFQPYSIPELTKITIGFAFRHQSQNYVTNELAVAMALACRDTPRVAETYVFAARDLAMVLNRPPTPEEVLEFVEVEPDGMSRKHIQYITTMRQFFARATKDETIEYIVGEAAMAQILRETKAGLGRLEAWLVSKGLVDRTPRGRRLTQRGIARAEDFIKAGKGASVA